MSSHDKGFFHVKKMVCKSTSLNIYIRESRREVVMMSNTSKGIRFDIQEQVHLNNDIHQITQLEQLELTPRIKVMANEEQTLLKGHLLLSGVYNASEQRDAESFESFEHYIPVEITLPMARIQQFDNITVDVDQFDFDFVSSRSLSVSGVLAIQGLELVQPTQPEKDSHEEQSEVITYDWVKSDTDPATTENDEEKLDVYAFEYRKEKMQGKMPPPSPPPIKPKKKEEEKMKEKPEKEVNEPLNVEAQETEEPKKVIEPKAEEKKKVSPAKAEEKVKKEQKPAAEQKTKPLKKQSEPQENIQATPSNEAAQKEKAKEKHPKSSEINQQLKQQESINEEAENVEADLQAQQSGEEATSQKKSSFLSKLQKERKEKFKPTPLQKISEPIKEEKEIEKKPMEEKKKEEKKKEEKKKLKEMKPGKKEKANESANKANEPKEKKVNEQLNEQPEKAKKEMKKGKKTESNVEPLAAEKESNVESLTAEKESNVEPLATEKESSVEPLTNEELNITIEEDEEAATDKKMKIALQNENDDEDAFEHVEWKNLFLNQDEEEEQRAQQSVKLCIVQKNETIITIAEKYSVSAKQLQMYNRLEDDTLEEGNVLTIPKT